MKGRLVMQYIYKPKNPNRYAVNLRPVRNSKGLEWDIPTGQTTLIVQCPFGDRPSNEMEQICSALEEYDGDKGVNYFFEILPNIKIRFISAAEKGRNHGCPISGLSCTYMVFAVESNESECIIYAPQMQAMTPPFVDIPTEVHVTVEQQTKIKGMLNRREVPTGFYLIIFDKTTFNNYTDGDLVYTVDSLQIPITSKMIDNGMIYIKSDSKPKVEPNKTKKGIRLV